MKYGKIVTGTVMLAVIVLIAVDGKAVNGKLFETAMEFMFALSIVEHCVKHASSKIESIAMEVKGIIEKVRKNPLSRGDP